MPITEETSFRSLHTRASPAPSSSAQKLLEPRSYQRSHTHPHQLFPTSAEERWLLGHSQLDSDILTQGLQRELSSGTDYRARSLQERPLQQHQLEHRNSFGSGMSSSLASSDLKQRLSRPNSPYNLPSGSIANSMAAAGDNFECKPQPSAEARVYDHRQDADETKMTGFGSSLEGSLAGTNSGASSAKLDESTTAPFAGDGMASSGMPSSWARGGSERPIALSAQAAAGAAATKVGKRRSRATNKPPITVLSADTANFRAMVQKLTGIPPSPSIQRNGFQLWSTSSGIPILKPQPTRPVQNVQGLPTLDTSFLLLDGASSLAQGPRFVQSDSVLQNLSNIQLLRASQQRPGVNPVGDLGLNRGVGELHRTNIPSVTNSDLRALLPGLFDPLKQSNASNPCFSMPSLWDPSEGGDLRERLSDACLSESLGEALKGRGGDNSLDGNLKQSLTQSMFGGINDMEQLNTIRQAAGLDSLIMGSERMGFDSLGRASNTVSSWLSPYDGALASHAPKIELAHSAA